MQSFWSWVSVAGGLVGACACSSDDEPDAGSYEAGLAALCDGLSEGYRRCRVPNRDYDYCGYSPEGYDGRGLVAVGACLRSEDCEVLASDEPAANCFDEAGRTAPLRQVVVDYCESASLNYFRCNSWWSVADCSERMRLWNDATLLNAVGCHQQPCEELSNCETIVFEHPR